MKKIFVLFACFVAFSSGAQVNPHAIGVRGVGVGNVGSGLELSYQHGLGDANRLELDLGASADLIGISQSLYLRLTGSYHWVFNITSGFNWFVGPAVQIGSYHSSNNGSASIVPTAAAGAQGGVEFDFGVFDVPLLVSVDARPMIGVRGSLFRAHYGTAASVRYIF